MSPKGFLVLILEFNISVAVIASLSEGTTEIINGKEAIASDDLVRQLFGDAEAIASLNWYLEGQPPPRMWMQGDVLCLLCKPTNDRIVGLIHRKKKDMAEQVRWNKMLNGRVESLWKQDALEGNG